MSVSEDTIRQRAYELWEQAGRPDGGDRDFWFQAERDLADSDEGAGEMTQTGLDTSNFQSSRHSDDAQAMANHSSVEREVARDRTVRSGPGS